MTDTCDMKLSERSCGGVRGGEYVVAVAWVSELDAENLGGGLAVVDVGEWVRGELLARWRAARSTSGSSLGSTGSATVGKATGASDILPGDRLGSERTDPPAERAERLSDAPRCG